MSRSCRGSKSAAPRAIAGPATRHARHHLLRRLAASRPHAALNELVPDLRTYIEHGGCATAFERLVAELDRVLDELTPNAAAFAELHDRDRHLIHGTPAPDTSDDAQAWERAQAIARDFPGTPLCSAWPATSSPATGSTCCRRPRWPSAREPAMAGCRDRSSRTLHGAWRPRRTRRSPASDRPDSRTAGTTEPRARSDRRAGGRRPFFDALIEIHATVLRAELTPPPPIPRQETAIEQVMRLHRGDWVELTDADGSCRRERLTWISPQRGIPRLLNHHGQGAIQISPEIWPNASPPAQAMLIFDQPATGSGRDSAEEASMSNQTSKVVSINAAAASAGRACDHQRLPAAARRCALPLADGIRAAVSEELFLLADGTREPPPADPLSRPSPGYRTRMEHFLSTRSATGLADAAHAPRRAGRDLLDIPDFAGLELVEDETLSEQIVLREFPRNSPKPATNSCTTLDRRMRGAARSRRPVAGENPLSPTPSAWR